MLLSSLIYTRTGMIDALMDHTEHGIIPISLSSTDPHTAELFARALAGEFGSITPAPPAPPTPVPQAVPMRSARIALVRAGLYDTVNTAIASMPGSAGDEARITWEFSNTVERSNPLIAQLQSALGLSDSQIDNLFVVAAGL